jgi:hypothetical protein
MKTSFEVAPIDSAILALLQMVQPVSYEQLAHEARGTIVLKILNASQLKSHLDRLKNQRYILETQRDMYVVAPKGFPLVSRGLTNRARDQARLIGLNQQRFHENSKQFGLGA